MGGSVLVTGAAGRIGRVLARGLAEGGRPLRLTDLLGGEGVIAADLTDPAAVRGLCDGVGAVLHLAGHPNTPDWDVAHRFNVDATRRLLDEAVRAGVPRFIYASSVHVLGMHPADVAFADNLAVRPDGAYGWSKASAELLLRYHADRHGLACFALRIASFRPAPTNARELRTWLSPADAVRLVEACLHADAAGFTALWGISNNRRARVDRDLWNRIGYRPQDDAEHYADALRARGVDVELASEWPLLGAHFAQREDR